MSNAIYTSVANQADILFSDLKDYLIDGIK